MSAEISSAVIGDGAAQGPPVPRSESVKSAYRTLQLLELLGHAGQAHPRGLQRRLGVPKSSLHGLLQTLAASGWVEQRDGSYGIGVRALGSAPPTWTTTLWCGPRARCWPRCSGN